MTFPVVVFGATGFTGKLVADYLSCSSDLAKHDWAIVGRNEKKLKECIDNLPKNRLTTPKIIIADLKDEQSLKDMVKQTKAVITTAGPYATFGELLLKTCAESGTHYCDLSGEHYWNAQMIEKYDQVAKENKSKIVLGTGVDSIPSDMGVFFCEQQMKGHKPVSFKAAYSAFAGTFSGGTLAAGKEMAKFFKTVDKESKKRYKSPYSTTPGVEGPDETESGFVKAKYKYDSDFRTILNPFFMAPTNARIVRRSLAHRHAKDGKLSVKYAEAITIGAWVRIGWLVVSNLFGLPYGESILKTPIQGEGPPTWVQKQGYFRVEILGVTENNERVRVEFGGNNDPGYLGTSKMMGTCGMLLGLSDDLPENFGVITPSLAFGEKLIEKLKQIDDGKFLTLNVLENTVKSDS